MTQRADDGKDNVKDDGIDDVQAGAAANFAPLTDGEIVAALALIGLEYTPEERGYAENRLKRHRDHYAQLRTVELQNHEGPAFRFDAQLPAPAVPARAARPLSLLPAPMPSRPDRLEDLAFWPISQLARLVHSRQMTSRELTELYLDRLQAHGGTLECVITLAADQARAQAAQADAELAQGQWRGPLHGIPWGAKDLLATRGLPTTWGAPPFREQMIDLDATVVTRLREAGAVLTAKLTMGSLAWGDVWFGGRTRSPWNLEEGSSGSSAGSGAATAAGLVGFGIGTETFGSIVSPSNQCGTTGLRPTFGRVSRHGAMTLCWTLDKIGPLCRSAEDCALVFDAIRGPDGKDATVENHPFEWPARGVQGLKVGVIEADFEQAGEQAAQHQAALATLEQLGMELVPLQLPDYPLESMQIILWAEAAAAFDDLTRSGRDDLLVRQGEESWPNRFRVSRLIPAVEYIQANRVRLKVMQAMAELFEKVDLFVAPAVHGRNLWLTNATGHPSVAFPHGFRPNRLPTTLTFTGKLFDEATILMAAKAFQDATDFHLQKPPRFV
ncbi:MAG: amidase [Litorilinea sp.]